MRVVEGADCDLEIGTLTELMCERQGPMLLFDRIHGYPAGYRIAAKPYATTRAQRDRARPARRRHAVRDVPALARAHAGLPPDRARRGGVGSGAGERAGGRRRRPHAVPVPRWHEQDGGPYFGTGCSGHHPRPRRRLGQRRHLPLHAARRPHHRHRHRALPPRQPAPAQVVGAGQGAPVAVAISTDPYLFWASTEGLPWGTNEYEYAGFIAASRSR